MSAFTGSVAEAVFETLSTDAAVIAAVAGRISPYVRNRDDDFPAVLYSVPREDFESGNAIGGGRTCEIEISALARKLVDSDSIAEKCIAALTAAGDAATCLAGVRVVSIERDFLDAYDGSVSLIYRATVRASAYVSGI